MKQKPSSIELLAKIIKNERAKNGYDECYSDSYILGRILAHYFDYDGVDILRATYSALEDSNFHTANETISKLIKQYES